MQNKVRTSLIAGAIALTAGSVQAATTFNVAEDILPGGLSTLQDERDVWASAVGAPLATEGFESLTTGGSSFDFGDFSVSLDTGSFTLYGANSLVRTEGTNGLGFSGNNIVTFLFDTAITSFGIDWSSFDRTATNVAYSDNGGGSLGDIFVPVTTAGAGFFGVNNTDGFTQVQFTVTQSEILEFDFVQYGNIAAVPVPASLPLLFGAIGLLGFVRRKKS